MKRLRTARGCELYQTKDGSLSWYIRFSSAGKTYYEPIGPPERVKGRDKTLEAARWQLKQRRHEVQQARREGRVWRSEKDQAKLDQEQAEQERAGRVTFREFEPRFLRDFRGKSGKGVRSDHHLFIGVGLVAYFGDTPLAEIDNLAVDRYARHLDGLKLSDTTRRKRLTALGTRLRQAHRWGLIDTVPETTMPAEACKPYRDLTPAEWRAYVRHVEGDERAHSWELPFARLVLATASRRQELIGLLWQKPDAPDAECSYIDGDYLHLWQGKVGTAKRVPIGKVARAALEARQPYRFASRFVFCRERKGQNGTRLDSRGVIGKHAGEVTRRRFEAAGIRDTEKGRASLHSLRSTAGTWLADAGTSELLIGSLLGHRMRTTMTQRYVRIDEVPQDVVDRLDSLILAAELVDQGCGPADTAEGAER